MTNEIDISLRISIIRIYTLLKAAKEDFDYINQYKANLNKKMHQPLKQSFVHLEYLLNILETNFKNSKKVATEYLESQHESGFDLMEKIEKIIVKELNEELNKGLGVTYLKDK